MSGPATLAAGGVLWRHEPGDPEVALVHRPKYDDWSLPKGKAKAGEHLLVTALREVTEETGYTPRIGPYLTSRQYRVTSGGHATKKVVAYWSMRCAGGSFQVNSEVDQMEWLPIDEARRRLTAKSDRAVLDAFKRTRRDTEPLLLVRHGATVAPPRRPKGQPGGQVLNRSGRDQAASLVPVLEMLGVTDLLSADQPACFDMLAPIAAATGLPVRREAQLTDTGFLGNEIDVADRVRRTAASGRTLVVCGGRQVVSGLLNALGHDSAVTPPGKATVGKGGLWLLHHRDGIVSASERH
ncbi:bifunctional NUDIX hydrolase/histidine phosphatase family protein [Aeromicrobium sp.]